MAPEAKSPDEPAALPDIDFERDTLLLDVDGTLLDIAPAPDEVWVPESLREDLRKLNILFEDAIAIVSGRPVSDIDNRFLPLRLSTAGCHGAEMRLRENGVVKPVAQALSIDVIAAFKDIDKRFPGVLIENKIYTLAFHFRAVPESGPALMDELRKRVETLPEGFELLHGKAVAELKSSAFNKGNALRQIMREKPFAGRRPIFFGDDTTDVYALEAVHEFGGFGVSIGRLLPGANAMIASPAKLRAYLSVLARNAEASH
jgi:trehalose 6-phosphate phosphatase